MKKQNTLNIILMILLVLAVGYIVVDKYVEMRQQEKIEIFQQGMQAGYEQAIVELVQQAGACQPVPVRVQNQTINMIATECLQQNNN